MKRCSFIHHCENANQNYNKVAPARNISLKQKGHSDICYNMDEPEDIMLSNRSLSEKDKYCMVPIL